MYVVFTSDVGPWQWPYRGTRIGEASNPGPLVHVLTEEEEEDLFGSTHSDDERGPPCVDLDADDAT